MATGATEFIDATTADAFMPEIWSTRALIARQQGIVMVGLSDTGYTDELSMGDTLHVPSITHLTAQTKNWSSNAAIVYETQTETNTDIVINTWGYQAIALETPEKRLATMDLLEKYAPEQGYALALQVDDALMALIDPLAQTVGVLTQDVSFPNWLTARQYLYDANTPISDIAAVVAPATEASMAQLPQFMHADWNKFQTGDADFSKLERSFIGSFMGIPIYRTTNVDGSNAAGHYNGLFQREAFAAVVQMSPVTHRFFDVDYLVSKVALEQLFGVKTMRADHAVVIKAA